MSGGSASYLKPDISSSTQNIQWQVNAPLAGSQYAMSLRREWSQNPQPFSQRYAPQDRPAATEEARTLSLASTSTLHIPSLYRRIHCLLAGPRATVEQRNEKQKPRTDADYEQDR
ncbi:uncharacterized protein FTJAE_12963 [Fusarium tjaetaba]|uniref:Uncharacterized protein n=1 Tax=Fusarium tjaetaba TaxID=1567544 RepID=A0A8H5VBZ1_9HYPO|nr:uncharacterized protein FTJAE_12963 [Fusarium tjaetaba]KAF5616445.1 hypothetical protein FTJAE_12963 [Fusarium tjaetaba]